jgi:hypothetical protein
LLERRGGMRHETTRAHACCRRRTGCGCAPGSGAATAAAASLRAHPDCSSLREGNRAGTCEQGGGLHAGLWFSAGIASDSRSPTDYRPPVRRSAIASAFRVPDGLPSRSCAAWACSAGPLRVVSVTHQRLALGGTRSSPPTGGSTRCRSAQLHGLDSASGTAALHGCRSGRSAERATATPGHRRDDWLGRGGRDRPHKCRDPPHVALEELTLELSPLPNISCSKSASTIAVWPSAYSCGPTAISRTAPCPSGGN